MDREGALLQLPPVGVVEDAGEAFYFVFGVCVWCVPDGDVLVEEAVLCGLEHCGRVVDEKAVFPPDCGYGAVVRIGHGIVQVAYRFVGEFVAAISLMLLGDALLFAYVPLPQVRPDIGYLRSAVMYVVKGLWGVGVEDSRQVLLRMPESMEHIRQGHGWLVPLSPGLLLEAADERGRTQGSRSVGSC